jgi:hypothetical protein
MASARRFLGRLPLLRSRRLSVGITSAALAAVALATAPAAQAAAAFNAHLTRAPYLTDLLGLHVNVNWATDQSATTGTLQWGPVTGGTCTLSNTMTAARNASSITVGTVVEYQWKAALTLPAQGRYCYRPLLAGTDLLGGNPSPQFTTQAAEGDTAPFTFDVFGDWGLVDANGNSPDMAKLFAQAAASGARFAMTVGDNGYNSGSQINYGDLQQTGASTSAIFGPSFWTVAGSSIPLFTSVGNHGLSGTSHTDITTWTEDQAVSSSNGTYANGVYNCCSGRTVNYGNEWYAFDAGPARFYVLDSAWGDTNGGASTPYGQDYANHWSPGSAEYQWLLADLRAHPGVMKFAFMHYPWYSANSSQASDTFMTTVQPGATSSIESLLGQNGVKIVFNGHAHIYQRNNPSAPGMPVTYVSGGGGGTLEPVTLCGSPTAYAIGWSPTKLKGYACGSATAPTSASQVFHFLKVTVNGSSVTVAPTDENGNTFDVQTYNFGGGSPTLVQAAGSTTATVTLPRASTQGDLLVLSASVYTGATNNITSVTDTAGNTWTRIGAFSVPGRNSDGEMWYSPNAASATAVTVHLRTTANTAVEVQEFAGVATSSPLDTSAGTSSTSAAASSGPITPAAGNELLVGFAAGHGNAQAMTVTAAGFTLQPQQTTGASVASVVAGSEALSSPSGQAFTATFPTAMYWAAGIAAFRAAG